jgi:hypothetical protein
LPCEWLPSIAIITENKEEPVSGNHLILLDGACRQLILVLGHSRDLAAQGFYFSSELFRRDKDNVGYIILAAFEVGRGSEVLSRLRIDEVRFLIDEVNTIRIADGRIGDSVILGERK